MVGRFGEWKSDDIIATVEKAIYTLFPFFRLDKSNLFRDNNFYLYSLLPFFITRYYASFVKINDLALIIFALS